MRSSRGFAIGVWCLVFGAAGARAFDRAEWLDRREAFDREAATLREEYVRLSKLATTPAENVTVPVETFTNGTVKTSVQAEKAQYFLDSGYVWGENVTLRQVRADGTTEAEIKAEHCIVDRKRRCGWAEGRTTAFYGRNTLSGENVYFSLAERYFRVTSGTELTASGFRFGSGASAALGRADGKPPPKKADETWRTVLKSGRADYDNAGGVVLFDGDVTVDDGEYRLGSQVLWAFADGTNSLRRIEAMDGVWLTNGARNAACALAVYDRGEGRLVMSSGGTTKARLAEEGKNRSEIEGRRITFWIDSEQVEVEESTVTIGAGAGKEIWKRTL